MRGRLISHDVYAVLFNYFQVVKMCLCDFFQCCLFKKNVP